MKSFTIDKKDFGARDTLECGQIFRFYEKDGAYRVFSLDKYAEIRELDGYAEITCSDEEYFRRFFDLDRDYGAIKERLKEYGSEALSNAVDFGGGIRILNQDLYETIISFIISANNNIGRIRLIIERLCTRIGEKTEYGYAFPTAEALRECDSGFFAEIGCGYRAEYLAETVKALNTDYTERLKKLPTEPARRELLRLKGVGPKVADCILLFGLGRKDVFPTDVWIKRVYHSAFEDGAAERDISSSLTARFGELSGYAQQYLFYYYRENALKDVDKIVKK